MVVTYELTRAPVPFRVFIIRTQDLISLGSEFAGEFGKPALPVRVSHDGASIRLDWSCLFIAKTGTVRSKGGDSWDARGQRSERVRRVMYSWSNDSFSRMAEQNAPHEPPPRFPLRPESQIIRH